MLVVSASSVYIDRCGSAFCGLAFAVSKVTNRSPRKIRAYVVKRKRLTTLSFSNCPWVLREADESGS